MGNENEFIHYAKLQKYYENLYGKNVCIFYMIGSFYEIMGVDELGDELESIGSDIQKISDILGISATMKNKKKNEIPSKTNPRLAGFPLSCLDKYTSILTENDYTVVIVDQKNGINNKKCKREVSQVLSKTTNEETKLSVGSTLNDESFLLSIYISETTYKLNPILLMGCALINTIHGKTYTYEPIEITDSNTVLEEIQTIKTQFHPKETIVYGHLGKYFNSKNIIQNIADKAYNYINLYSHYSKEKQRVILNRYANFSENLYMSAIETIGLEFYQNALRAFIGMIEFVFNHKSYLIKNLEAPTILDKENTLTLSSNTLYQLDIQNILQLLNNCITQIGKREFEWRIKHPLSDTYMIQQRHETIEKYINSSYSEIRKQLKGIIDLERYIRKITIHTIQPFEIVQFVYSCQQAIDIITSWCSDNDPKKEPHQISLQNCFDYITNIIDCSIASKYSFETVSESIFYEGFSEDIDKEKHTLQKAYNQFIDTLYECNKDCTEKQFYLEKNEIDGYYIKGTRKRFEDLQKRRCDEQFLNTLQSIFVSSKSSEVKIYLSNNNDLNKEIQNATLNIKELTKTLVQNTIIPYMYQFHDSLKWLCDSIKDIDCITTSAYNAIYFNYSKPTIQQTENSWISAKKIRHPLIENNPDVIYKPNDICLGKEKDQLGILLFGENATGKSSLMKSVGISVILAQAGMFVPAIEFEIAPYKQLYSRFPTGDSILKGKSTFMLEMEDLRHILHNTNNSTLVIGDEIANGTESKSALSIVASSLNYLVQKNTSFIFASHMLELINVSVIQNLKELQFKHLHVYRDDNNDIVYDRTLQDGPPENHSYGLEIISTLDFPNSFIHNAFHICNTINQTKKPENLKATKYNSKTFAYEKCYFCGNQTEEVHHIIPQSQYRENNSKFISEKYINHSSNLLSVCSSCHDAIHNNNISINGWYETNSLWKLQYQYNNE